MWLPPGLKPDYGRSGHRGGEAHGAGASHARGLRCSGARGLRASRPGRCRSGPCPLSSCTGRVGGPGGTVCGQSHPLPAVGMAGGQRAQLVGVAHPARRLGARLGDPQRGTWAALWRPDRQQEGAGSSWDIVPVVLLSKGPGAAARSPFLSSCGPSPVHPRECRGASPDLLSGPVQVRALRRWTRGWGGGGDGAERRTWLGPSSPSSLVELTGHFPRGPLV